VVVLRGVACAAGGGQANAGTGVVLGGSFRGVVMS